MLVVAPLQHSFSTALLHPWKLGCRGRGVKKEVTGKKTRSHFDGKEEEGKSRGREGSREAGGAA